MSFFIGALRRK